MKLSAAKIKECAAWVEAHGLYPQPHGRPVKEFCAAMDIKDPTYRDWLAKSSEFASAIASAQKAFASRLEVTAVDKLIERATGSEYTTEKTTMEAQVVEEFDPHTGKLVKRYKTDKGVIKQKVIIKSVQPPDVGALQYLLNNIAPERWAQKQQITHEGELAPINVRLNDEKAVSGLRKALANGAKPAPPQEQPTGASPITS